MVHGIAIEESGSTGNVVEGNYLGTDVSGLTALPNGTPGVTVGSGVGVLIANGAIGNTVGGPMAGSGNIVSGNADIGVQIAGQGTISNLVEGNYLGSDVSGSKALPNGTPGLIVGSGVGVQISYGATANTIGGTIVAARNVISGNLGYGVNIDDAGTSGNVVEGNYIGLNQAGDSTLPNQSAGVVIGFGADLMGYASSNTIGGAAQGAANVISGNGGDGIDIVGGSGNVVIGDFIGTENEGVVSMGNAFAGVSIYGGATGNYIGGNGAGYRNIISGNGSDGVDISGTGTTGNVVDGDYIGTNVAGTSAFPNTGNGVATSRAASGNHVGGSTASLPQHHLRQRRPWPRNLGLGY